MNIRIILNGRDVTDYCLLADTRINYDSSRRISTASVTILGGSANVARYDQAHYDQDVYSIDIRELMLVSILDGRDGVTKLFEGMIFSIEMAHTDAPDIQLFYKCELNDYGAWLDRAVCWNDGTQLTLPNSDKYIIETLVGHFCPQIVLANIQMLVPSIMEFDWLGKTCRQIVDDLSLLSLGDWRVDYDAKLYYAPASAAPPAPFRLSTSPDYVTSFPVRVNGLKSDFSNPVNKAYVRGNWNLDNGTLVEATYEDAVSMQTYGVFEASIVDDQIMTGWDASLRAKSMVLRYAYPIESGTFTIWKDGLACGQLVELTEDTLGIDDSYLIRSLSLAWEDNYLVRYEAQFGGARPDLETLLRLIEQRNKWKVSKPTGGVPLPGSVSDESIANGGLHEESIASVNVGALIGLVEASQIGSVNANTLIGQVQSNQIGSVNAGAIVGAIQSTQIGSVTASVIQGLIQSGQIGSINAAVIQGVVVSSQLADRIIDDLAKYADALRPVPMVDTFPGLPSDNYPPNSFFYYKPDGHFYQITGDGLSWNLNDNVENARMNFYHIGNISAKSITGLILAAQIQSITAGQITGAIQASQIGTVNASSINGQIQANQIAAVNATAIQGAITATQIQSINAEKITGSLTSGQIGSINAATITIGLIAHNQIGSVNAATLTVGKINSDQLNATGINVGGGGNKPGVLNVMDAAGSVIATLGAMSGGGYGGWFKVFGAGGTSYANAKVYTDVSGNLFVREADYQITSGSYVIKMSPTTYGTTYGSLAMSNTDGTSKSETISRGFVVFYGAGQVASLVGNGVGSSEMTLYASAGGAISVQAVGNTGLMRANKFHVIGTGDGLTTTVGYNKSAGGTGTMWFTGGILTALT